MFISPLDLASEDEELTEQLLRYLVENGYEGEGLIAKFKEIKPLFFSIHTAAKRSEEDIAAGRVHPFEETQALLRQQYGL